MASLKMYVCIQYCNLLIENWPFQNHIKKKNYLGNKWSQFDSFCVRTFPLSPEIQVDTWTFCLKLPADLWADSHEDLILLD